MDAGQKEWAGPSRSAKKRAAQQVEELAHELAEMAEAEWRKLPAPPELRDEIRQARETRGHGARKRQIKHLAGVLRRDEEETAALRDFLDGHHARQLAEKKTFHALEELRDRLCDPALFEAALQEVGRNCPGVDSAEIARLARLAQAGEDRRAYREIFRRLREGCTSPPQP
jgi:ribosome-associated protein